MECFLLASLASLLIMKSLRELHDSLALSPMSLNAIDAKTKSNFTVGRSILECIICTTQTHLDCKKRFSEVLRGAKDFLCSCCEVRYRQGRNNHLRVPLVDLVQVRTEIRVCIAALRLKEEAHGWRED
ncbi:hypothetical protein MA16_Dca024858 [Dendrobium catenatum]|uniref:Uncharacterized protein n=1 Tax=Dendrobium catenatum TaxID=906689 RepID=A0A2I0V6L9_9ASPA|nr:hypothetical protein MA16_Dca024858 [Dendrobium catenatum]